MDEIFMDTRLSEISAFLQQGRAAKVKDCVQQALDAGIPPEEILEKGLMDGMNTVGQDFKQNKVFVPEVLIAARAMTKGIEVLRPYLVAEGIEEKGTVVIGTVKGDLHDIGKNLVHMMMEGKGLRVIDLGVDVSVEQYLDAAQEYNADVIVCSALLTTTMSEMKAVMDAVKASPLAGKVKVMIGGAPVTQAYCDIIGADCYTPDAASAADAALAFCMQ
ncbi:MAG: corrinoid protein [Eisenbergiella massiliensis]|uniref:corrinoid protein n=1 Tax=Eisenbergiella massiliensis TaxID=1720294 RepID=UPI0023EFF242|nr:corrinoid protein [Eisenbergiella massiliensis]MCI6706154.1 corrinoid protein [Eisenbergiella massiliensis]